MIVDDLMNKDIIYFGGEGYEPIPTITTAPNSYRDNSNHIKCSSTLERYHAEFVYMTLLVEILAFFVQTHPGERLFLKPGSKCDPAI